MLMTYNFEKHCIIRRILKERKLECNDENVDRFSDLSKAELKKMTGKVSTN
jgi:hypothetical protein